MMNDIWKKRSAQHQKKMMHYLKYVLNDHFVIVCLFLFGALGYAYSELLKSLTDSFNYGRVIAVVVFYRFNLNRKTSNFFERSRYCFFITKRKRIKKLSSISQKTEYYFASCYNYTRDKYNYAIIGRNVFV